MGHAGRFVLGAAALIVAACAAPPPPQAAPAPSPPGSPVEALRAYYDAIPDAALPTAPAGPPLPRPDAEITRILLASCLDEELDAPAVRTLAGEKADLMLMLGDNVYGDLDTVAGPVYDDPDLTELRSSFAELAASADFAALRRALPMMAVWDDHDYGKNDGGREFLFKEFAERIHEQFWGLRSEDAGARPGVHQARTFGPEGRRVQVILLDTRFFRSPLTRTDEYGAKGKERYIPAPADAGQDMLGAAQWGWLEAELKKPADLRLLVSSIQVTPDVHGWEAWATLPKERAKLYDLLRSTGAGARTIFVSGDRHSAHLYANTAAGVGRAIPEITASSLNKAFSKTEVIDEHDPQRVGDNYAFANYGSIAIDWAARTVKLAIHAETGAVVREMSVGL